MGGGASAGVVLGASSDAGSVPSGDRPRTTTRTSAAVTRLCRPNPVSARVSRYLSRVVSLGRPHRGEPARHGHLVHLRPPLSPRESTRQAGVTGSSPVPPITERPRHPRDLATCPHTRSRRSLGSLSGAARDRAALALAARIATRDVPIIAYGTPALGTLIGPRLGCRTWNGIDSGFDPAALCLSMSRRKARTANTA